METTDTIVVATQKGGALTTDLVTIVNDTSVTTSLKIAEVFGKDHSKVIRAIENALRMAPVSQKPLLASAFVEATYQSEVGGRTYKMYYLNRDGLSFIIMGFTGKKAAEWKWKYIQAFNAMEEQLKQQGQDGRKITIMVDLMGPSALLTTLGEEDISFKQYY